MNIASNATAFASTFLFFATHNTTAEKNKKELASQRTGDSANMTHHYFGRKEARTDNSGFKKLGVQWFIEHSTSHQHLWWLDSFVLRNPQLLKPAKRCTSPC